MIKRFNSVLALMALAILGTCEPSYALVTAGPTLNLKNSFGEVSHNWVLPGSSDQIDASFIVDSTNGNGLGIRSLKGAGVAAVYMHTSATPAAGNPNPAAGYVLVQLTKNYAAYLGGYTGFVQPVSGTPINVTTGVSAGLPYVITSVGTTTASGFQALGLPLGLTPTPGQAFIAPATTTTTGSGQIQAPAANGSGVQRLEVIGDANLTVAATGGATIVLAVMSATSSSVTTPIPTAPANNTVIGMRFVYQ